MTTKKPGEPMKVFVHWYGDEEKGIPAGTITVDSLPTPVTGEARSNMIESLAHCFSEVLENRVWVEVEGEQAFYYLFEQNREWLERQRKRRRLLGLR